MDVVDGAKISEVHAVSIFTVDPEDGGSMYLRNFGRNVAYVHTL
jgi:hypothetical protein